jgi:hypothetical protein
VSEYRVEWRIDVDADSPLEAAMFAEEVQSDQVTGRTDRGIFVVKDDSGQETVIELQGRI